MPTLLIDFSYPQAPIGRRADVIARACTGPIVLSFAGRPRFGTSSGRIKRTDLKGVNLNEESKVKPAQIRPFLLPG